MALYLGNSGRLGLNYVRKEGENYVTVKVDNSRLLYIKKEESEIIEVESLYASILPTIATVYFVESESQIVNETCITNKIGESNLKLKL